MQELWFNQRAHFTRWIIASGLLQEPFVVVDVGVQGGTHPRWELLGDHLIIHGFDAISEVVDELKRHNVGRSNRHFYNIAIGDSDEERSFYFNAADPSSSSMHKRG